MKSLTLAFTLALALLAQANAFGATTQSVSDKLSQLYGIEAGDIGVKCNATNGAAVFKKSEKASAVSCVMAYFRTEDPAEMAAFQNAMAAFGANEIVDGEAVVRIDGIWVHLIQVGDLTPQPGVTVHN